ncbi:putative leucine-rich repeat-containing protein DDB_G0290503 isoform X2 [Halyomorpha halys]|uniref:putative leucine-rich repeat-containing protein DDB_G0290503 isoform X2 n=1 Tax=Halyomorpha halys TaxID=286706 RepID=UPI0006D4C723|nr:uncharacterized protein LOC106686536 [Halyomorpha halys]
MVCLAFQSISSITTGVKNLMCRFPQKRPKVLQQWLMVLDRLDWTPKPSSKICSDHFAPEDFLYRPNVSIPRLKPEAVPSIFPDPSTAQEETVIDEITVSKNNDIKNSKGNEIKISKVPPKIEGFDIQNQENVNENSMKQEIKQAGNDDIYPKRPRRISKINVKMKDFILLDDFRKLNKQEVPKTKLPEKDSAVKLKSPEISKAFEDVRLIEKSDTPPKPITTREVDVSKVDAAKELLSILEDSDDESLVSLQNKNKLINNSESNNDRISNSLSSSPENVSPLAGKVQPRKDSHKPFKKFQSASKSSKKLSHSGVNIAEIASRVKAANYPARFPSGRPELVQSLDSKTKTLKQKSKSADSVALLDGENVLTPQYIIRAQGSDTAEHTGFLTNDEKSNSTEFQLRSNKSDIKFPMRMRTKRPSTDLAKTYFPIRCGENFFYFSYADLNPMVDLSKDNILIKSSSKNVTKEVSSSPKKFKSHLKGKLKRQFEELENVEDNKINEIEEQSEEDSSPPSEGDEAIAHSDNENNDEPLTEVDEASESNETNIVNTSNPKDESITPPTEQGESVSDLGNSSDNVQPDEYVPEFDNTESHPSPAKKRKKRFKTVAEIVVRTDNTKPGEAPNVSIDKINKIVDFKAAKSPYKNPRRSTRSTNEATNSVDFNDNLSHITVSNDVDSSEEELARIAERITDTVKRMKLLDRVKGNASKLTVLITALPPVKEKEILIIKKKNIETNIVQSRELQVVISSNKASESSLHGNIVVTNPIGYTIIPTAKNNTSGKSLNDVSSNNSEECESTSQDQEHPTIVCFQDKSGNKEATEMNPVPGENTESLETPNETIIESEDTENNSSEAIIHDHPYISPNVKYLLSNPNVSINLAEVQPKEPPGKMKLSENEIIFRNKVSKKLRSLKDNIQKKNDAISKLKDKIKYLERNLKEVKRNRKNPLKTIKKESAALLKNDIFYGVEQLVDTSDFSNTMDYSLNNIELPLGLDENGEESDDDGERECASPITYLCEPAIEVPSKDRETGN